LQCTFPESQPQHLLHMFLHPCFQDDIVPGYAQIDVAFADEGGYVGGGKEDSEYVEKEVGRRSGRRRGRHSEDAVVMSN
jgi:hypothetical protein